MSDIDYDGLIAYWIGYHQSLDWEKRSKATGEHRAKKIQQEQGQIQETYEALKQAKADSERFNGMILEHEIELSCADRVAVLCGIIDDLYKKDSGNLIVTIHRKEQPLPQPENGKRYWVKVKEYPEPVVMVCNTISLLWELGDMPWEFEDVTPLRNKKDNSLYECPVPTEGE